jgi:hypothetical protein
MKICPKCRYLDHEENGPNYECPKCGVIYSKVVDDINREKIARNERNFDQTWNKIKRAPEKAFSTFWIWAGLMAAVAIISGINIQRNMATVDHVRQILPTTSTPPTSKSNISNFQSKYEMRTVEKGRCGFKVIANGTDNVVFILLDKVTGKKNALIYVKAGDELEIQIPAGKYGYQMIQGTIWLGDNEHFGVGTKYLEGVETFTLEDNERGYTSQIVTLQAVNGNLHPSRTKRISLK